VSLARALVRSPQEILQHLCETALQLCRAGSCGISIIEDDGGTGVFRWHALVGALAGHRWETTPRSFSPCGTVVDTNTMQLMSHIERHFTYFADVKPAIVEALLVPFALNGRTVGTIWVVMHDEDRHFDAEDGRLLANLGEFAAAAYQVKSSLETVESADRRKEEFLATLAHELRNPLAALQSAGYFISKKMLGTEDPGLRFITDVHQRQLTAMTRMIEDLMDVSRITRNKIELRREPVELAQVVRDAVEMGQPLISMDSHELFLDVTDEPCWIDGDPTRLVQIVANLISNAVKFSPPGGRIFLSARPEDSSVVIRVRDEGIGIAPQMVSRIFEPFAQIDIAHARSQGGLGIGLSLAKRLTELHGGTLHVHSAGDGCGSEFTVRLPRLFRTQGSVGDSATQVAQTEPTASGIAKRLRVLVVDDNHDSADAIALLLQVAGHDVRICYDGLSALKQAAEFAPEVMLQDIGMPNMGGLEVARRARLLPATRNTVLIALSGYGQARDVQSSLDAGFAHHLVKPVDFERLVELLAALSPAHTAAPANTGP
jgi:signal transduction histidine kinase/ActR/RegA family two-component response regulator